MGETFHTSHHMVKTKHGRKECVLCLLCDCHRQKKLTLPCVMIKDPEVKNEA